MPDRRAVPWRGLTLAAAAAALAALVVALGVLNPPREAGVYTDHLGPEHGEQVTNYLNRSRDSLSGSDEDPHWALLSFTEPVTPGRIPDLTGGVRVAQVLYRVSIPRVQTPLVSVPVPDAAAAADSARFAAWLLPRPFDDRTTRVVAVTKERLNAGCACVVGLVVRGPLNALRDIAAHPGVRAVQALPADALAGRFAVTPLLPEYVDVVLPGPDDGPVPEH